MAWRRAWISVFLFTNAGALLLDDALILLTMTSRPIDLPAVS